MKNYSFSKNDTRIAKGVALLLLIFHHTFYVSCYSNLAVKPSNILLTEAQLNSLGAMCKMCVPIFIMLTGIGMYKSSLKHDNIWEYTLRRLKSLAKTTSITFIALLPFILMVFGSDAGDKFASPLNLILNMLGLSSLFGCKTIIGAWWYFSLNYVLVLVFPIIMKLANSRQTRLLPLLFGLVCAMLAPKWLMSLCFNFNRWILPFICGIYLAKYGIIDRVSGYLRSKNILFSCVILGLCVLGCALWFKAKIFPVSMYETVFSVVIILIASCVLSRISFANKALLWLGDISMYVFMSHMLITRWDTFYKFAYSFNYNITSAIIFLITCLGCGLVTRYLTNIVKEGIANLKPCFVK